MNQFRYIAFLNGEKFRAFNRRDELNHWLQDKPEATYIKYTVAREKKEKINLDDFEPAPF